MIRDNLVGAPCLPRLVLAPNDPQTTRRATGPGARGLGRPFPSGGGCVERSNNQRSRVSAAAATPMEGKRLGHDGPRVQRAVPHRARRVGKRIDPVRLARNRTASGVLVAARWIEYSAR